MRITNLPFLGTKSDDEAKVSDAMFMKTQKKGNRKKLTGTTRKGTGDNKEDKIR